MKIFVEGSSIFKKRSGVGQYALRLIQKLLELDEANTYTLFGFLFWGKKFEPPFVHERLNYKFNRFIPNRIYSLLLRLRLAPPIDLLMFSRPDLIFFPNFALFPVALKEKRIVVIHDLSYIRFPEFTEEKNLRYLTRVVPESLKKADHVITISESSKNELLNIFKIEPSKISIVSPGVDMNFFNKRPASEVDVIKNKYGIKKKYLMYEGNIEPRKNISGVLEAYSLLPETIRSEYSLVLVGGKGWRDLEIQAKMKHSDVITTGYVPDEDLPALYTGAGIFLYPSFYEGFGMPVAEAMACGTPVITSDNTSLPEVGGDAVFYIKDPKNAVEISESIQKIIVSDELRTEMSKKGVLQASRFSWDNSAKVFLDVIGKL